MTCVPHGLTVPVNTSVLFPSYDNRRHNVDFLSNATTVDIKVYVGFPEGAILFYSTGVVALGGNIHDKMHACIGRSDTPRRAVTDADGHALRKDVPAEPRERHIWHEWLNHGETGVIRHAAADTYSIPVDIDITPPPAPPPNESMSLQQRFDRIAQ